MKLLAITSFIAFSVLTSAAQAQDFFAINTFKTNITCSNESGLPNGLSVSIQSDNSGNTRAVLTNRVDIGPYVELGKIDVTRKPTAPNIMGAPLVYTGKDFELTMIVDAYSPNGAIPSQVYADIGGQVFNEPMTCSFLMHTL